MRKTRGSKGRPASKDTEIIFEFSLMKGFLWHRCYFKRQIVIVEKNEDILKKNDFEKMSSLQFFFGGV